MSTSSSAYIPFMERETGTGASPFVPGSADWVNGVVVP